MPPQQSQGVVKQSSAVRRSFTVAKKRKLLHEYAAQPRGQKLAWLRLRKLDYSVMSEWNTAQQRWAALPKEQRPSLNRRRAPGGGRRKAQHSPQVESSVGAPADNAAAAAAPAQTQQQPA